MNAAGAKNDASADEISPARKAFARPRRGRRKVCFACFAPGFNSMHSFWDILEMTP